MRKILEFFLLNSLRTMLWFRYRVTIKGLEHLTPEKLSKPGGVLLLPNHVAMMIDPSLIALAAWKKIPVRPTIAETYYYLPIVNSVMKFINALPVPDFEASTNNAKRKRHENVLEEMVKGLKNGENFLIYPAGRLKHTAIEEIGGASATHQVIQNSPEANVVLVRIKGLWGSMFSRALHPKSPDMFEGIWKGLKITLKNLVFFNPRRHVIIEFYTAPEDFPYQASRLEMNRWLEKWYNKPDGLTKQEGEYPGDSLVLVSYSMWRNEFPKLYQKEAVVEQKVRLEDVSVEVQDKVLNKIQQLTDIDKATITPEMSLASDLGMDSLDASELAIFLQEEFGTDAVPVTEMTTVSKVLGIASKKIKIKEEKKEDRQDLSQWFVEIPHTRAQAAPGNTIPEVFLRNCQRMGNRPACGDDRSGIMSYSRLRLAVILMAECIRHKPGKYIGILLPASVGAYLCVLAIQLAGKVPLMINWTVGPRHLKSVREISKVETVLTSRAFLERLDTTDLTGVDDILVMLEDVKKDFSVWDKIRALFRSKLGVNGILKTFGVHSISEEDQAVLLFTSGTESMPKGVPLSHKNLLSNQRAAFDAIELYADDVMLGILPPFHAYGFSTSGLMGLLAGMRCAYYPNPTDGQGVAAAFSKWGATVMSGAPSFIKGVLKAAEPKQVKTMRLCVTGAEKAPPELFKLMAKVEKEHCLLEGYGVTECSPIISANRFGKPRKGVGSPLPGIELIVVHPETHEILPKNTDGLVLTRGPNVFSGYLNPGQASPFVIIEGAEWYNTGDIGHLDQENRLTLSGRLKRFIKVGGEMISLLAIESALLEAAPKRKWPIREEGPTLALISKDGNGEKPSLVLIVTFSTSPEEVNQQLKEDGFSNLVRISEVHLLDEIPIMGTGKINYRVLEERFIFSKD